MPDQAQASSGDFPESAAQPASATSAGHVASASRRRHSAWYLLGVAVQCLIWMLVFLGLILAILGGQGLTEFRYVGF